MGVRKTLNANKGQVFIVCLLALEFFKGDATKGAPGCHESSQARLGTQTTSEMTAQVGKGAAGGSHGIGWEESMAKDPKSAGEPCLVLQMLMLTIKCHDLMSFLHLASSVKAF